MTFQQDQQQPSSAAATELDNLINELVNNNLVKVRELLVKIEDTAKNLGINTDEIDVIIHSRYVDALKKKIMTVQEEDKNKSNNNNTIRSPYLQSIF